MRAIFAVLVAIHFAHQGSPENSQSLKAMQTPPPNILSKAWMMLAEQGPVGFDFTTVAIIWKDGAFYMHIHAGRKRRWKVKLTPPLRDKDWRVRIVSPKEGRVQALKERDNHKDPRVAWSRSFASAIPHLPPLFADPATFKVRAVPDQKQIVYYLEISTPPAWITFTVRPSGEYVYLDSGY